MLLSREREKGRERERNDFMYKRPTSNVRNDCSGQSFCAVFWSLTQTFLLTAYFELRC